jgi:hypothetical protein
VDILHGYDQWPRDPMNSEQNPESRIVRYHYYCWCLRNSTHTAARDPLHYPIDDANHVVFEIDSQCLP